MLNLFEILKKRKRLLTILIRCLPSFTGEEKLMQSNCVLFCFWIGDVKAQGNVSNGV